MTTPDVSPENTPLEDTVEPQPGKQIPNWKKFAGGFAGWYIVNGAIWWVLISFPGGVGVFLNLILFPLNAIVSVVLAIKLRTRLVGLGILTAIAINLLLSLIIGTFGSAICFIPFYINAFGF